MCGDEPQDYAAILNELRINPTCVGMNQFLLICSVTSNILTPHVWG